MCRHALEANIELRRCEKTFFADADLSQAAACADMRADEIVDIFEQTALCERKSAASTLFGRLEEYADLAAEFVAVIRAPMRQRKADRAVAVVPARMH